MGDRCDCHLLSGLIQRTISTTLLPNTHESRVNFRDGAALPAITRGISVAHTEPTLRPCKTSSSSRAGPHTCVWPGFASRRLLIIRRNAGIRPRTKHSADLRARPKT